MNKLEEIKCCDMCRHESSNPCHDFIDCLNSGPSCHTAVHCLEKINNLSILHKREIISIPLIYIGMGTCGINAGAKKVKETIQNYLFDKNIDARIIEVGCIGICYEEPLVDIQLPEMTRVVFKKVQVDNIIEILDSIFNREVKSQYVLGQYRNDLQSPYDNIPYIDELPFFIHQTKILTEYFGKIDPADINDYIAYGGFKVLSNTLKTMTQMQVCDIIELSKLRGRSRTAELTGVKWKNFLSKGNKDNIFICNTENADPGPQMERTFLESDPFSIIEGMLISGYAIGAKKGYIFINSEFKLAINRFKTALLQAKDFGLVGTNILDSGFDFEIQIKENPGAKVCIEERALINSINGNRPVSQLKSKPNNTGINKNYVVEQLETIANIPKIIFNGADWFQSIGSETSNGTKLFTLAGNEINKGLIEVSMGTDVSEIISVYGADKINSQNLKAIHIGGPFGGIIPSNKLNTRIDFEELSAIGITFTSSSFHILSDKSCMVDLTSHFMKYISEECCGNCIPCREGTKRMYEILSGIKSKEKQGTKINNLEKFHSLLHLNELTEVIRNSSACSYGINSVNPVLNIMKWFRDEFETHIYEKTCPANVCEELLKYRIIDKKCNGCTDCLYICPVHAIVGSKNNVHFIINDICNSCGICVEECSYEAIELI